MSLITLLNAKYLEINFDPIWLSISCAILLLWINYIIIKRKGLHALREKHIRHGRSIRLLLDVLLIIYVAGVFVFATFVRNLN